MSTKPIRLIKAKEPRTGSRNAAIVRLGGGGAGVAAARSESDAKRVSVAISQTAERPAKMGR